MTYRELAEWIRTMTNEQKDSDVIVFSEQGDEYIFARDTDFTAEDQSVLDEDHPIICI